MAPVLIEAQYLPTLAYFTTLASASEIIVEKFEHYEKQTFRTRTLINTVHGKVSLTIPVESPHAKRVITDIKIDNTQKWLNHHLRTIQSGYGKAPFFEYYYDDLSAILLKKFQFLYDLNFELLTMCLRWLRFEKPLKESKLYEKNPGAPVLDLRSRINPKKPEQLELLYRPVEYKQVFGNKFVDNLSLIDLIFCEGPGAREIIHASNPDEHLKDRLRF
jgi:hypothetical protein